MALFDIFNRKFYDTNMYRGSGPRIFPLIIVILVVALVIAALVSIGRVIFSGTSDSETAAPTDSLQAEVLNTSVGSTVRWTVRGPIVANENFTSYQITVGPDERTYIVYSGYLDREVSTRSYSNNTQAYDEFVHALDKANIDKTRNVKDEDIRGVCATDGLAYTFETLRNNESTHMLWSSTCPASKGTLGANVAQIHALFANQIPDFTPRFDRIY